MNELASPLGVSAIARSRAASRAVLLAITALGGCAAIAQLALMRELVAAFSGNELTFGIAFGAWLVLTAAGTALGRRIHGVVHRLRLLVVGVAFAAALPLAAILAIRGLRDLVFPPGAATDPIATTLVCFVVLAPFCLASGSLLIVGCRTLDQNDAASGAGRIYAADAIGSVTGAAAFTFLLSARLDHAAVVCWPAAGASALAALVLLRRRARALGLACGAAAVAFAGLAIAGNVDGISTAWQHRHREIVWHSGSPYGRLVVTRTAGQLTFFDNGVPVAFTADAVASEEIVHYALAQRPDPRSVLLVGGAITGAVREILRYPTIRNVTCIELDPRVIAAGRVLLPTNFLDPRVHVVVDDGRRFVRQTRERFDAILIALPDPATYQLNRFYTAEFFAETRRVLQPRGVLAIGLGRYENFVSSELAQLVGSGRRTLATAFPHVVAIPGGRVFLLGSDAPLVRDFVASLQRAGVAPRLVNRDYLDATLTPDRLDDIDRAAATAAPINTDFHPVLYLFRLRHWLSQFAFPAVGFGIGLAFAFGVCLVRFAPVPRLIFAAGFASSALEIAALLAFQVLYGSLYRQVGVVVGVFMAGLALGAWFANRLGPLPPPGIVRTLGLAIGLLALCFATGIPQIAIFDRWIGATLFGQTTLLFLTFLLAALVGAQFAMASSDVALADIRAVSRLFSSDLLGAAFGAFLVSAFVLPLWGMTAVCLIAAGLNLFAAALASSPRQS